MSHASEPDWDLLATYLSGEATAEEERAVEDWIGDDSERKDLVDRFRRSWKLPDLTFDPSMDVEMAAQEIMSRLDTSAESLLQTDGKRVTTEDRDGLRNIPPRVRFFEKGALGRDFLRSKGSSSTAWTIRAAVASLGIAAVVGVFWLSRQGLSDMSTRADYATGPAERTQVTLPDGSRMVLAPSSRLEYSTDARGARMVTLSGQAYFTVTPDPRRPFTVQTGGIQTQVLGTAFGVRHYAGESVVRVAVVTGKVSSRGQGAPHLLVAGTEGQFTDSTALIIPSRDAHEASAWTDGRLVFDDTPVPVVLQTLQRWYGYEFRLADSTLAKQQVTAMFAIGDTTNTMAGLKMLLDVTLRFDGSIVTLYPVRRPRQLSPPIYRRSPAFQSQSEVGK